MPACQLCWSLFKSGFKISPTENEPSNFSLALVDICSYHSATLKLIASGYSQQKTHPFEKAHLERARVPKSGQRWKLAWTMNEDDTYHLAKQREEERNVGQNYLFSQVFLIFLFTSKYISNISRLITATVQMAQAVMRSLLIFLTPKTHFWFREY